MTQSRKLAAIMFTDIVGYTALMGEDELSAFELLKKNRAIQRPIIEKFNGRWLKEIGDGVLASFSTVSDAVYCAKEIQETCLNEPALNLRIGIHLGEVVFEGNDVFGDGVNIASRLESLAPIGGILVSESVYRNLGNKRGIETTFYGKEQLKNVQEPIKVYSVQVEGATPAVATESAAVPKQAPSKGWNLRKIAWYALGGILILLFYFLYANYSSQQTSAETAEHPSDVSIAVLPFDNFSLNKAETQYLCDGFMEEILNQLSKIRSIQVRSRSSVEQFRTKRPTSPEIAQKLRATHLIEGSVQLIDNELKVVVQLIEGEQDKHIWQNSYQQPLEEIFEMQSDIAESVADQLELTLTNAESRLLNTPPTDNLEAYDFYLCAEQNHMIWSHSRDPGNFQNAITLYQRAGKEDPKFAQALLGRARMYLSAYNGSYDLAKRVVLDSILVLTNQAAELNPNLAEAYATLSAYFRTIGNSEKSFLNAQKAWDLQPDSRNSFLLGSKHCERKNYVYGLQLMHKGERLAFGEDHLYWIYQDLSLKYVELNDLEMAHHYWNAMVSIRPNSREALFQKTKISILLKQWDKLDSLLKDNPKTRMDFDLLSLYYLQKGNYKQASDIYKKAQNIPRDVDYPPTILFHDTNRGMALWLNKEKEAGEKLLEETLANYKNPDMRRGAGDFEVRSAAIHAFLGNKKEAYNQLYKSKWID